MGSGQRFLSPAMAAALLGMLFPGCEPKGRAAAGVPAGATEAPSVDTRAALAPAVEAPTRVTYPADPVTYTRGQAITPNIPFVAGGWATSFSLTGALPKGLAMDPSTGVISGTPTEPTGPLTFLVTATNALGHAVGTVTLTVHDEAPSHPPVITLPPFLTAGRTGITATVPEAPGIATTYAWAVSGGTITSGQGTPSLTFTAGTPGAVRVTLTTGNSGGSVTGSADTTCVPPPNATLTYPVALHPLESATAHVSQEPGMSYTWELLPGTGTATLTSSQNAPDLAFTAGEAEGTFQLHLTVQNQASEKATASATIAIKP